MKLHATHEVVCFLVALLAAHSLSEGDPRIVEWVFGFELRAVADRA
jgi:hypothetical protein